MALICDIHNAKPNLVPNGSSSCKKRTSTAWRKLIMANESKKNCCWCECKK